jgi:hypothetical protein
MTRTKLWMLLGTAVVATCLLAGCSGALNQLIGDGNMSAEIGGSDWESTASDLRFEGNTVVMSGSDYKGRAITITLSDRASLPTMVMLGTAAGVATYTPNITSPGDTYTTFTNSGTVQVESITTHSIKGTFNFRAKKSDDTEVIIDFGRFDLSTE